jgi:hypothetical protein
MTMQTRQPVKRLYTGLVGLSAEPTLTPVQNPTLTSAVINEDELRDRFGVEERSTKPKLPDSYRKFFGLEPDDLIKFFDVQIGSYPDLAQVDFVVPPSMIQHRLRRLQKTINYANEIIKGLSVGVMKVRRGKENVLDKPTREKYKREEQVRLARCYATRAKYYAAAKQEKYVEKVWRIVEKPICFRDVIDDCMVFTDVVETKWVEHADGLWLDGEFRNDVTDAIEILSHGQFDLDGYKRVMKLGFAALAELGETHAEMQKAWKNLLHWENAVIAAAVAYHVIDLPFEKCEFLGLTEYVKDLNDQVEMEDFEQRDFNPGELEVLEGRADGADDTFYAGRMRIQSAGFRYHANGKPTPRTLSSFDKPTKMTVKR